MLPQNPFLQLAAPRVYKTLRTLAERIWYETRPLEIYSAGSQYGFLPLAEAKKKKLRRVTLPAHWGMEFDHGWFKVILPQPVADDGFWFRWQDQERAIAGAAFEMDAARQNWLGDRTDKTRTLTALYNKNPTWLVACHAKLDAAVAAAYGFPADLTDEAILERLLALNQAGEGLTG